MRQPPFGLCVPCAYVSCRDGDTVVVRLRSGQKLAVRLIDCWAPERRDPGGAAATEYLRELVRSAKSLALFVPLARDRNEDGVLDVHELLAACSFDRVPARLFADGADVSQAMVRAGLASRRRGG